MKKALRVPKNTQLTQKHSIHFSVFKTTPNKPTLSIHQQKITPNKPTSSIHQQKITSNSTLQTFHFSTPLRVPFHLFSRPKSAKTKKNQHHEKALSGLFQPRAVEQQHMIYVCSFNRRGAIQMGKHVLLHAFGLEKFARRLEKGFLGFKSESTHMELNVVRKFTTLLKKYKHP